MTYYERKLPHWHPDGRALFITWRLYGSLPREFAGKLRALHKTPGHQFAVADLALDGAAMGPRWLTDPVIAGHVDAAIKRGVELGRFLLDAYVVMPNHVHVLLEPIAPLRSITNGIKGASSRCANIALARTGEPFWQDESYDHWIRSEAQFERVVRYIENNPVKAGLTHRAENWRWSSAWKENL